MKSFLIKAAFLTSLSLGFFNSEAAAEFDWSNKCSKYGDIKPNSNPSFQHLNCLLTNAALDADIPPEVVKAVAWKESNWIQFDAQGNPLTVNDGGMGMMQITNHSNYDQERLKKDVIYNIQAGIEILNYMYNRPFLPKVKDANSKVIENWYFPVMAYNGIKPVNSPIVKKTNEKNTEAYQEKVFAIIEEQSFMNNPSIGEISLGQFPFKPSDFQYDPDKDENIVFIEKTYVLTGLQHSSTYFFKPGDMVLVTLDDTNFRKEITSEIPTKLKKNTTLIINGSFLFDPRSDRKNHFVWYPVKTEDGREGYISSAYIKKKVKSPTVTPVYDKTTDMKGKAESNTIVYAVVNGVIIGESTVQNGEYSIKISRQSAGTSIIVYAKDSDGNSSESNIVKVINTAPPIVVQDRTPPKQPVLNPASDASTFLTGKAEKGSLVTVIINGKTLKTYAKSDGNFILSIGKQKAGNTIKATATDAAGNKSGSTSTIVMDKTAPSVPKVNPVTSKSKVITGTGEANNTVYFKISNKTYSTRIQANGKFSISIPLQKKNSVLLVTSKDPTGNTSKTLKLII